jgi:beta-mannosidase
VGFRSLDAGNDAQRSGDDPDRAGLRLRINGVPVFARGAVWTPIDVTAPHSSGEQLRATLERVKVAGMNMLRIPGTGCYESPEFYDLCDQLGLLVWQDFMFANLDYPESDEQFMASVRREARALLEGLAGRPCPAVFCGGSEVAQQVAMLGLDPELARGRLFGELLPREIDESGIGVPYVPSTPWGGDLPFRPGAGVANYYGVGAYLRPLEDARRSEVKFAAECLAFSNVPEPDALEPLAEGGVPAVHDPKWKRGVPRDVGAGWDFEDVRDHYLRLLHGVDPVALRSTDLERYLELSRAVSGEVMAETFGEWRRATSTCAGALVLWLRDLYPGAGWGVLDHRGMPKVAYMHLRRVLAPVAVWSTDEGLGGIVAHIANDTADPLRGRLRVALYRDFELKIEEASTELSLAPHEYRAVGVEELIGRFVDVSWAYRFGPPAQDLVVISLEHEGEGGEYEPISQAFRFPAGPPSAREPAARLGLEASLGPSSRSPGDATLTLSSTRFAYGVRVDAPGYEPDDGAFNLEPGHARRLLLRRHPGSASEAGGRIRALNLDGYVAVQSGETP